MSSFGNLTTSSTTGSTSGGVLAEIIAIGAADTHLTANPEVTFWRLRVQRCTNVAMESVCQTFENNPQWGGQAQVTIPRCGDAVNQLYLIMDLPALRAEAVEGHVSKYPSKDVGSVESDYPVGEAPAAAPGVDAPWAHWVNSIGHAAIAQASFSIGGQIIDTVYNHYMHMWEELAGKPGKRLEEMIGKRTNRSALIADSSAQRRLYTPLPFYFTQFSGNCLSVASLQFHTVKAHVRFSPLSKMIQVSGPTVKVVDANTDSELNDNSMRAMIDVGFVYMDKEERQHFSEGSFQQLIQQVQVHNSTFQSGTVHKANLTFNHPAIELLWCIHRKKNDDANNTFKYGGYRDRDPITKACLALNNNHRFDREAGYFRMVQPWEKHSQVPKNFIYNYSFALMPESAQPTGSLNLSRIDSATLTVGLDPKLAGEEVALYVFCRSWNILRFKDGLGGTLYSN